MATYIVIGYCDNDSANHQEPVDPWNVNLSVEDLRSMNQFDLGKVRKLDNLRQKLLTISCK